MVAQRPSHSVPEVATVTPSDAQQLSPQTAEIVRRFGGMARHRPDFVEVPKLLRGDKDIYATFQLPTEMFPIGYRGPI